MNKDTFDKPLSLLELNSLVAAVVDISLPDEYWVEAELSEAREVRGHCYMELVEKDEYSNTPTARASAKCWASRWSLLRPKFEQVISIFREELDGSGIASWTEPRGRYFLSFDTMPGCAARTVELCRRAGVKFTPAGSTWP